MTYALLVTIWVEGFLVPRAILSEPVLSREECHSRIVRLISGETEAVRFKAWCLPLERKP